MITKFSNTSISDQLETPRNRFQIQITPRKTKKQTKCIRISLENFGEMDKIDIYPLYGMRNLVN